MSSSSSLSLTNRAASLNTFCLYLRTNSENASSSPASTALIRRSSFGTCSGAFILISVYSPFSIAASRNRRLSIFASFLFFTIPSGFDYYLCRRGLLSRQFQFRLKLCHDFLHAKLGLCKSSLNHCLLVRCNYRHYFAEDFCM